MQPGGEACLAAIVRDGAREFYADILRDILSARTRAALTPAEAIDTVVVAFAQN